MDKFLWYCRHLCVWICLQIFSGVHLDTYVMWTLKLNKVFVPPSGTVDYNWCNRNSVCRISTAPLKRTQELSVKTQLHPYIFPKIKFTKWPTLWSRVLLRKLTGYQSRNFPHLMEIECSLLHSQEPTTCRYSKPYQSSSSYFLKIHFNIILPIYAWIFQAVNFPQKININKIRLLSLLDRASSW